jgi:hypothetical protein
VLEKETTKTLSRLTHDVSEVAELPTIELGSAQLRDLAEEIIAALDAFGKNDTTDKSEPLLYSKLPKIIACLENQHPNKQIGHSVFV